MTSEEQVKEIYPRAFAEKYQSGKIAGMQETYYLIWRTYKREEKIRLGEGDTKTKAWKNAKEYISYEQ